MVTSPIRIPNEFAFVLDREKVQRSCHAVSATEIGAAVASGLKQEILTKFQREIFVRSDHRARAGRKSP